MYKIFSLVNFRFEYFFVFVHNWFLKRENMVYLFVFFFVLVFEVKALFLVAG